MADTLKALIYLKLTSFKKKAEISLGIYCTLFTHLKIAFDHRFPLVIQLLFVHMPRNRFHKDNKFLKSNLLMGQN